MNIGKKFDPLNEDPDVIPGQTGHIKGDADKLNQHIPGASHNPDIIDIEVEPILDGEKKTGTQPNNDFNPDFDDQPKMSEGDKKEAAERSADAYIDGYCQAKMLPGLMVMISERKLKKLDRLGLIDMYMSFAPKGSQVPMSLMHVVERFNQTVFEPLQTSEEFKGKVKPVLTRILIKRGGILSDEAILAGYLAEDLIKTGQSIVKCAIDRSELIDEIKDAYERQKAQAPPAPVTPDVSPTATDAKETVTEIINKVEKSE